MIKMGKRKRPVKMGIIGGRMSVKLKVNGM
jgi:hypothetical protein